MIFVDSSAPYALLVRTEERHEEVKAAFSHLLHSGRALITSNYVLLETCALLQHRIGLAAVRDLTNRVVPVLAIRWIDEPRHRRAIERVLRTNRRQVSLVDCSSFVLMDDEGIDKALALDPDFEREGFRLLLRG